MTIRPHQRRAVQRLRAAYRQARRVCLVLPTGGGKTITASACVHASGRRTLWLAHRAELVAQAADTLRGCGLHVGVLAAGAAGDPGAPVQVASIETMLARGDRPPADLIVWDECHHAAAASWSALLAAYPDAWLLGLTATPERGDGVGLGAVFQRLIVGATVADGVGDGWLVPSRVLAPPRALGPGQLAAHPADAYARHAAGRPALLFAPTVALAEQYAAAIPGAVCLDADTPADARAARVADLRAGRISVICNCMVLTEGFDAPNVSAIILARRCSTAGTYLQIVGRALRPAPGKADALILDLTGASHVHGAPGDDRVFSLDGRGIRRPGEVAGQAYCRVCGCPVAAGETCPDCGAEPREIVQRVVNVGLAAFVARMADADARAATLRRWQAIGRARGYKPGWAHARMAGMLRRGRA